MNIKTCLLRLLPIALVASMMGCGLPPATSSPIAAALPTNPGVEMPDLVEVREPPEYSAIAAGAGHTCMVTTQGKVLCWGANQFGQLGGVDGLFTPLENGPAVEGANPGSWAVSSVGGLEGRVTGITAGYYHNCVITTSGGVQCWGWNAKGQLGDGTTRDAGRPVRVAGLVSAAKAVAAGAEHTCVIVKHGTIYCWGANESGQLGNGTESFSSIPVEVQSPQSDFVQIAAGVVFTCALTQSGEVYCWGNGENGRFGDGTKVNYLIPVRVDGLDGPVRALAAGDYHLCAHLESGVLNCWGALSSEAEFTGAKPYVVQDDFREIMALAAGGGFTCVITTSDAVKCWGDNYFGQLGDGSALASWEPVNSMGLNGGVYRIAAGAGHVCVLKIDGSLQCWGDNSAGQCGDSTLTWVWNQYTNTDYHFAIDYPSVWQVADRVVADGKTPYHLVWFARSEFPPDHTDARADIELIITREDPMVHWAPEFFDNYKINFVQLDGVQAIRISGTNKESLSHETVLIIEAGDYFIQAMSGLAPGEEKFFLRIMSTLKVEWSLVFRIRTPDFY